MRKNAELVMVTSLKSARKVHMFFEFLVSTYCAIAFQRVDTRNLKTDAGMFQQVGSIHLTGISNLDNRYFLKLQKDHFLNERNCSV